MNWFTRIRPVSRKARAPLAKRRRQPTYEVLENRDTPSTVSSIAANFNGTAIPAGDTIWFSGSFQAGGLPPGASVTLHVENGAIDFTSGGTPYHVAVPNGVIVLTPGATSASTSYDPNDNDWDVSAPTGGAGNVFMGGVALPLTSALPGGIQNVTWTASFWSDTNNINVNWKWAAAVYTTFSTDYNALNVKPVDNNNLSVYKNGDKAGTPEAFKSSVTAGALGGGGNNYTGNFTGGKGVTPQFGQGAGLYPYASSNPLTSIAFNESTVLKAASLDTTNGTFDVWYSDEHALALGVGTVVVKTSSGSTTTNYPIAPLPSNPGSALNPALGSTATTGDQAGTDVSTRPMAPSLFITDTTTNVSSAAGDWQWGGAAYAPSAVFGTWKSFTRTVDYTTGTPAVSVTAAADPAQNGWNLGTGADAPPAGTTSEGYGAEVRWSLTGLQTQGVLVPGHTYRFYVMVHDGDQNKAGGDAGQAVFNYSYPGVAVQPASVSGFVSIDNAGVLSGLAGVTLTLTGTTSSGQQVTLTTTTGSNGSYSFGNLAAGTYIITETVPPGQVFESASVGTVGGATDGSSGIGKIMGITVANGDVGINYNFTNAPFPMGGS
jgi:hypothetical protein